MNKLSLFTEGILTEWGTSCRRLPENAGAMRAELLAKLPAAVQGAEAPTRPVPWFSLALAGMAMVSLLLVVPRQRGQNLQTLAPAPAGMPTESIEQKGAATLSEQPGAAGYGGFAEDESYPDKSRRAVPPVADGLPMREADVPASDSRQFLKTDYSASAETRNVVRLVGRLQALVKGYDGRVDGLRSSKESGSVEFVVPASRFESFRAEVASLVGERFFTEFVSTQNLLPEKRTIEDQERQAQSALTQLKTEREKLGVAHKQTVANLQSQIGGINRELKEVEAQLQVTLNQDMRSILEARKQELLKSRGTLQARLNEENWRYQSDLAGLDAQIKVTEGDIDATKKQDAELLDTVATVRGTISVSWIGLWEAATRYVPAYWLPITLFAAALYAYWRNRRRDLLAGI